MLISVRQSGTVFMEGGIYQMNKIRELAEQKKIKVSSIIKTTGLSKSFIYDVINERSFPTVPTGRKIAKSINSTLDEVFPDHN